ncbi:unnamed protein product [Zymoseptoria tritici ST99CH_3D1]|uniref:Uncharacterized protein n=1 Tax=Zymoseptoria tritici ST99CH_1E4 TaxID=1276532 RepID=A0A2H1H3I1_ZYMTR|nr:unnamed protein product [Zymoseptoria tritici ST99CH_1E4]SMR63453.1 unnamed protein product [Zymoseptoria tritici ST99CH_3D1]
MSRAAMQSAVADRDAVAYLQTLSIPEIRATVRITDAMCGMNAARSTFKTDEELIGYRNDIVRDLRDGPRQGGGVSGDVPWLDFVHAMVATGFEAEKLYGPVWNFRPTKLDVERSIQFHEPHPSGKIAYRVCRGHGRRLNRAYGWTGDNFVAEGKSAVALGEKQVN